MGHGGGGGHQAHSGLHASKLRAKQEKQRNAKKKREGMSRTQLKKSKQGKKKN